MEYTSARLLEQFRISFDRIHGMNGITGKKECRLLISEIPLIPLIPSKILKSELFVTQRIARL